MVITYVWSKYFADVTVSLLIGIRIKARFLPLALLVMDAAFGGSIVGGLLGILVGHLYYFVKEEWPGGASLLSPPSVLYDYLS
jgi:Derlin-2/3